MIMSIQKYPINLVYRPGRELVIANTLSRAYISDLTDNCTSFEFEVNTLATVPISDKKNCTYSKKRLSSTTLDTTLYRWMAKWQIKNQCLPFSTFPDQISFNDGVLFKGEKIIIPKAMQPEMLKLIHSSHLGIEKCKRRARDILYWPGMSSQIENIMCHLFHM